MAEVLTAHTAALDPAALAAARALLYDVFDDMTDHDWEHALGGIHALVWDAGELVGHARPWSNAGCSTAGRRCARAMWRVSGYARTGAVEGTEQP